MARGLPIDEDSILDQIPALGRHPFVIIADGGAALRLGAVGEEIAKLRTELKFARLVWRQKAGPGVVRFPPERAVQFGGMADRLVDGQPEIRRMNDEVVLAGGDWLRLEFGDGLLARLPGLLE